VLLSRQKNQIELLHKVSVRSRKQARMPSDFFLERNHSVLKAKMIVLFSISKEKKQEIFMYSLFALIAFGMTFNVYPLGGCKVHHNMYFKKVKAFISNMTVVLEELCGNSKFLGYSKFPGYWNPCDDVMLGNTGDKLEKQSQEDHFENIATIYGKLYVSQTELLQSLFIIK
jgi:hypothetical protein